LASGRFGEGLLFEAERLIDGFVTKFLERAAVVTLFRPGVDLL